MPLEEYEKGLSDKVTVEFRRTEGSGQRIFLRSAQWRGLYLRSAAFDSREEIDGVRAPGYFVVEPTLLGDDCHPKTAHDLEYPVPLDEALKVLSDLNK